MLLARSKTVRTALGFIETFNVLALKLFLKDRQRARSFSHRVFRSYMSLARRDKWRCLPIEELLPNFQGCRITFDFLNGEGIDTLVEDLAYLAVITRHLQPKEVFEIGTFRGRTTLIFALNSPADAVIHTLDLGVEEREEMLRTVTQGDASIINNSLTGIDYKGKAGAEKIRQHFGDSTQFDFSPFFGRMDLVFVDGAHHYAAALSDTRNALKLIKPGGWIVWHDWAHYGDYNDIMRAVFELVPMDEVTQIDTSRLAVYRKPVQS